MPTAHKAFRASVYSQGDRHRDDRHFQKLLDYREII